MKTLQDIKKGDIVFVNEAVPYGFNSRKIFTIPRTVERTTKTQIIVNGERYTKSYGHKFGGRYSERIYTEGIDQTEDKKKFETKLKKWYYIINSSEMLKCIKLENENLEEIYINMEKIMKQLEE